MEAHKADLRSRLVQEAMRILAENPSDLTLRGLARAADVSAMAPYRHFADKAALMLAITETGFEMLRNVLLEADRADDDREALIRQGLAYVAFAVAHPALFRLMFAAPKSGSIKPGPRRRHGLRRAGAPDLADQPRPRRDSSHRCLGHRARARDADARRTLPPEPEHARQVLDFFVDGLEAPRSSG